MNDSIGRREGKMLTLGAKIGGLVTGPDNQSQNIEQLSTISVEFAQAFDRHFQNYNLENIDQKRAAAARMRNRIATGRKNANKAFLSIGNAILQTEDENIFTPAEFEHLLSGGQHIVLMSKQQASMLRRVAKAIRDHIIPMDRLPEGYSVAYQCLLLRDQNPDSFQEALKTGLIRPETSRREIMALREAEANSYAAQPLGDNNLIIREKALAKRETQLASQLRDIREQLRQIREDIQKV